MSFFISDAIAAETTTQSSPIPMFVMLAAFGFIFYFMIFRPQRKRAKEHRQLMESISKGDEVLTTGGLIGRVAKVAETGYLTLALNETTEVMIKRDFVAAVLPKGTIKSL